jgi:hypothetical protein
MEKEWTFDQPTEEGFYWIEEGIGELTVVQLKKNIQNDLRILFPGETSNMELIHTKGIKWLGPISPPLTQTAKEEINE